MTDKGRTLPSSPHDEDAEFEALSNLIRAHLNQDMHEFWDSVPEAVADWSRSAGETLKAQFRGEMQRFSQRYHNDLEGEFRRRYWFDFEPRAMDLTVSEFFAMVEAILAEPESWREVEKRLSAR